MSAPAPVLTLTTQKEPPPPPLMIEVDGTQYRLFRANELPIAKRFRVMSVMGELERIATRDDLTNDEEQRFSEILHALTRAVLDAPEACVTALGEPARLQILDIVTAESRRAAEPKPKRRQPAAARKRR